MWPTGLAMSLAGNMVCREPEADDRQFTPAGSAVHKWGLPPRSTGVLVFFKRWCCSDVSCAGCSAVSITRLPARVHALYVLGLLESARYYR